MKAIIYRGFEIQIGSSYVKAVPEENKAIAYDCNDQQDAENFIDQYRDESGTHNDLTKVEKVVL